MLTEIAKLKIKKKWYDPLYINCGNLSENHGGKQKDPWLFFPVLLMFIQFKSINKPQGKVQGDWLERKGNKGNASPQNRKQHLLRISHKMREER